MNTDRVKWMPGEKQAKAPNGKINKAPGDLCQVHRGPIHLGVGAWSSHQRGHVALYGEVLYSHEKMKKSAVNRCGKIPQRIVTWSSISELHTGDTGKQFIFEVLECAQRILETSRAANMPA